MESHVTVPSTSTSIEFREKIYFLKGIIICLNVNFPDERVEQLRSFISEVHNMIDIDECVDFITNLQHEKVLLILAESMGEDFIPIFHDFDQIHEIYVFRADNRKCKRWISNNCPKYKGVFDDFTSLCRQIKDVARMYEQDAVTINLLSDRKASAIDNDNERGAEAGYNTQEASFMYFVIIQKVLTSMNEDDPKDMIDFCRAQHTGNESALAAVHELERDYLNHSPVWWYTKEGFLYKILNKALREQDVYTLYFLRIFIGHLYKQLLDMFASQSLTRSEEMERNGTNPTVVTLYRGQQMTTKEFEEIKNNGGGLLTFSNFLSTTANKNLAIIYAGNTLNDENFTAVLFQLDIDNYANEHPFAKIDSISYFGEAEDEYLFAMGSIFRIGRLKKLNNDVWNVQFLITNEFDQKLADLTEHLMNEIECSNPFITLGKLLWRLQDNEKAKFFYLKALAKKTDWNQRATIIQELGTTCMEDSKQALFYFNQSLEITQQHTQGGDHPIYSSLYNNIGIVYQNMDEYDLALVYLKESLDRELCNPGRNKVKLATRYNNIGMILIEQGEKYESERYLQQALIMALEVLPSMHSSIAVHYKNLAYCMSAMGRFVEAVDYQQTAVDIALYYLPPNHQQTLTYQNRLKSYEDALGTLTLLADLKLDAVGLVLKDQTFVYPRRK